MGWSFAGRATLQAGPCSRPTNNAPTGMAGRRCCLLMGRGRVAFAHAPPWRCSGRANPSGWPRSGSHSHTANSTLGSCSRSVPHSVMPIASLLFLDCNLIK